jgi:hypothetical protein
VADYKTGDVVEVNISAGIVPGANPDPDWQRGTVISRLDNGYYRIQLHDPIAGRAAEKDAAP